MLSLMNNNNTKNNIKKVLLRQTWWVGYEAGAIPRHVSFPPWSLRLSEPGQRAALRMAVSW